MSEKRRSFPVDENKDSLYVLSFVAPIGCLLIAHKGHAVIENNGLSVNKTTMTYKTLLTLNHLSCKHPYVNNKILAQS